MKGSSQGLWPASPSGVFFGGLETPQMALGAQKTILCFSMIYDDLIILRYSILVVGTWIYDDLVTFIDDL